MTLRELSVFYEASEELLRVRMTELRKSIAIQTDPEIVRQLRFRIAELQPMRREMRELSHLTAHYYDKNYHRDAKYTV